MKGAAFDGLLEQAAEAITELEAVVDDLKEIIRLIEREEGVEVWISWLQCGENMYIIKYKI
jgi:endonuclease IV